MKKTPGNPEGQKQLRLRAESRLLEHPVKVPRKKTHADSERLVQELQIHQIELEMQNEELKQTKAEVDAGLEKFTELYDFAPVGYFTLSADGAIQQVNLTGACLIGVDRSRLLGVRLGMLFSSKFRHGFEIFLKQVFASEVKQSGDFELLREDQSSLIVNIEAKRQLNGRVCHAVVVDITERKQAEDILRRNEALYSALLSQAPFGVYVVDAQFRLQQINPKALPIFKNIHPLPGRDFSEVLHTLWPKRVADKTEKRFRHTLKTGEPYQSPEFVEKRLDIGTQEAYEWQIQRITLPSGDHQVVCFFNDITERKRAEETQRRFDVLAASNAKLITEIIHRQAVEKALTTSEQQARLLLDQSRELQKKLRLMSHQSLLALENQRKEISHELHDKISQILIGINVRLAVFIRETGIKSRAVAPLRRLVEQSVRTVHQYSTDLRPTLLDDLGLIPALRAYIKDFPGRKGRKIQFSAFSDVEALDNVKRTMLYRVAQEALINVAKHAEASVVKVAITKTREGVCLEISDNGKGFETSRIASAQWESRHGVIGMRERVEMGGGKFSVESVPGAGTTIRVVVPSGRPRKIKSRVSVSGRKSTP